MGAKGSTGGGAHTRHVGRSIPTGPGRIGPTRLSLRCSMPLSLFMLSNEEAFLGGG